MSSTTELNFLSKIDDLLAEGRSLNEQDDNGYTILHRAIEANQLNIVKRLLKEEVDINIKNGYGHTPLHLIVHLCAEISIDLGGFYNRQLDILDHLLEKVKDVDVKDNLERTAIHLAVLRNNPDTLKRLLEKGANINIKDKDGYTPLHLAVRDSRLSMVEFLLENDADLNVKNKEGFTAVHLSSDEAYRFVERYAENLDTIGSSSIHVLNILHSFLLKDSAKLYVTNNAGQTPISLILKIANLLYDSELDKILIENLGNKITIRQFITAGNTTKFTKLFFNKNTVSSLKLKIDKPSEVTRKLDLNILIKKQIEKEEKKLDLFNECLPINIGRLPRELKENIFFRLTEDDLKNLRLALLEEQPDSSIKGSVTDSDANLPNLKQDMLVISDPQTGNEEDMKPSSIPENSSAIVHTL
ncbi:ankyrin repeat domain-containing protein [unidentified bacterial endosymbiont]|uniref:ankyrin repeat domain-containing protein n=1 Tax=unidentified bacterial endosymbiont TaxID=2355 RepID=UPI0020A0F7E3|nr:ankyrin repeat domain-containing protein [unidentified bacterial endosymbiont]